MNPKINILKSLIEQLVTKEVNKQLPILLQELLSGDGELVANSGIPKSDASSLMEMINSKTPITKPSNFRPEAAVPKPLRTYTKNPMINSILNETVNDLQLRESGRSPSVGLDGDFQSSRGDVGTINETISNSQFIPTSTSILDCKDDPAVKDLMKWDFSAILKKSMSKK